MFDAIRTFIRETLSDHTPHSERGAVLSDADIMERLYADGDLRIEPLNDPDQQIQPASVDVRLGNTFLKYDHDAIGALPPSDDRPESEYLQEITVSDGEVFTLKPGEFVLGTTRETVRMPPDLCANAEGRSSVGRLAVDIHATAGFIDPGYHGQITLELSNKMAPERGVPIELRPGMRICQFVFTQLTSPAARPYGAEIGSKYQNQSNPVASRIRDDDDYQNEVRHDGYL